MRRQVRSACWRSLVSGVLATLLLSCSSIKPSGNAEDEANTGTLGNSGPPPAAEGTKIPSPKRPTELALPSAQDPLPELNQDGAIKKKILVLPFQNRSLIGGTEIGEQTAFEIQDQLLKMPEYVPLSKEELPNAADGEALTNEFGEYRLKNIFEKCRANGISAFVTGSIEDLIIQEEGDEVGLLRTRAHTVSAALKFHVYDVASERLLLSRTAQAETTDETTRLFGKRTPDNYDARRSLAAVKKALEKPLSLMPDYAKRINWVGRIAKVDLHRYYINAGEATGLLKGQLLRVYAEGHPVVDSETGEMLGMAPGRFKGTLKVVDFFGNDGAVAVLHSGAGFREKDRVDLFRAH